jgi:hypothetical protein
MRPSWEKGAVTDTDIVRPLSMGLLADGAVKTTGPQCYRHVVAYSTVHSLLTGLFNSSTPKFESLVTETWHRKSSTLGPPRATAIWRRDSV